MSKLTAHYFKQNASDIRDQRAAIEKILKSTPSTISSIAETTGYANDLVFWNILGMMRWGTVAVESEEGEELTYKIKEV